MPSWCRWHVGPRPVLLIAPHGGRCDDRASTSADSRALKVNDVHTAELTLQLAAQLGASFIVNGGLDRNELDLNRISQVRTRAPWFLHLLERLLSMLVRRHGGAEVVFIHGWNVIQAKCDIGIGAYLPSVSSVERCRGDLTVSPAYLSGRLETLRAHCAAAGVQTTYGERYPASHPNNLLQLFRRDGARTAPAHDGILTQLAAAGSVEASQLELGVPLRWTGQWRDRFVAALGRAFADGSPAASAMPGCEPKLPTTLAPAALMFHDCAARLGVLCGVSTNASNGMSGRLLLFLGGPRVALFTGEDRGPCATLFGGPFFQPRAGGFDASFAGAVLEVDDGARYVHLEQAFHHSRLVDARAELSFRRTSAPEYGLVTGTVRLGKQTYHVHTYGFAESPLLQRTTATHTWRLSIASAIDAETGMFAHIDGGVDGVLTQFTTHGRRSTPLAGLSIGRDDRDPSRFTVAGVPGGCLVAEPLSRMRIRRPLGRGRHQLISFGVARVALPGRPPGSGFYEYSQTVDGNAVSGEPVTQP